MVRYAPVYHAKLDLLREYGFITEQEYWKVVPPHPAIADFCAREAVNCP
jgi:hypothetical protein